MTIDTRHYAHCSLWKQVCSRTQQKEGSAGQTSGLSRATEKTKHTNGTPSYPSLRALRSPHSESYCEPSAQAAHPCREQRGLRGQALGPISRGHPENAKSNITRYTSAVSATSPPLHCASVVQPVLHAEGPSICRWNGCVPARPVRTSGGWIEQGCVRTNCSLP
jgi:hypothetical protein